MHDKGLQTLFDEFEVGVCLPCAPPPPPKVTTGLPAHFWGDWNTEELQFGNVVYTDGSGLAAAIPGIRLICRYAATIWEQR
eukprot:4986205-Pyramimonas_sp.AAC.1